MGTGTAHTSSLHGRRNPANQLRCTEPTCQRLSLPTPHTAVRYRVHTCTLQHTHTCPPAGHCSLCDELLPTQRLQDVDAHTGPAHLSDLKLKVHSNRIGTEMTYSNTCDPARPPAESQKSITSQIRIPRRARQGKKKKALTQLTNPLPLQLCCRAVYSLACLCL